MAHITAVRITGLAGSDHPLELTLNRDINLIFGLNGSGKSSLLKILNSAMSRDSSTLRNVPFRTAEITIYSQLYRKQFRHFLSKRPFVPSHKNAGAAIREAPPIGALLSNQSEEPPLAQWKCQPRVPGSTRSWQHIYLPTWRVYPPSQPRFTVNASTGVTVNTDTEESLSVEFARQIQQIWTTFSAQLSAEVRKAQENGLADILKVILGPSTVRTKRNPPPLQPERAYERVLRFLKRQRSGRSLGTLASFLKRYQNESTLRRVVQYIDRVEQLADRATAPRRELEHLIGNMFTGPKEVRFSDAQIDVVTQAGQSIGLPALSSGEKHLLQLFVETVRASYSSMIIDEPELSLHIDWQKRLITCMRQLNPQCQLILATHSPEVMADIDDSKIFRLWPTGSPTL
jgi:predicted ATPase